MGALFVATEGKAHIYFDGVLRVTNLACSCLIVCCAGVMWHRDSRTFVGRHCSWCSWETLRGVRSCEYFVDRISADTELVLG